MGNEVSMLQQSGRGPEEVALMKAVLDGDVPGMQALLQQKQGLIYAHSKDGENIWHAAAQGGHPEVARAVHAAVEAALSGQKKQDKLRAQVNHGFNQASQMVSQVIASTVPLPIPSALNLPMGASLEINGRTRAGLTPLMAAAKAGKPEMVDTLLELGADAWLGDSTGATALHHAAWWGQAPCVEVLLQHAAQATDGSDGGGSNSSSRLGGPRLAETSTTTGLTPLHWAAWRGQVEVVKLLVNAGAPIAAPSSSDTMGLVAANAGSTPLHLAVMKSEAAVIRLLLRANQKLMALAAADPVLAAAAAVADAASGAREDLRRVADSYGKTPGRLAWDMERADLALILDPKTPMDQAIQLATAAAKAATAAAAAAAADAPAVQQISRPPQQQQKQQQQQQQGAGVRSSISLKRQAGEAAAVTAAGPVVAAAAAVTAAGGSAGDAVEDDGFAGFISAPSRQGPEPPPHLTCPITNELFKDPVRACDGLVYERDAIEVWFQLGNTLFPGGHAPIISQALAADEGLEQEAAAWRVANLATD